MKKIIFHVGFHKTATTTLQRKVFQELNHWHFVRRSSPSYSDPIYDAIVSYCFLMEPTLNIVLEKLN
jgi:hypothetical protein